VEESGRDEGFARPRAEDLAELHLPREGAERRGAASRRWTLLALLAALVVAAAAATQLRRAPLQVQTEVAVPWAEAAREPVPVLSGSGYLVPGQPFIAVGARVAGRVARYLVDEGDRVTLGQPLVELDPRPFQAAVDQAQASLASAQARLALAEQELARAKNLYTSDVMAKQALDTRQSEEQVARAAVVELEATLERARIDLEDSVIRAPTDGVVLETYKQPGEIAVPGGFSGSGDLLRLGNLAELRAELDVNESDLTRVRMGQQAQVIPDAFPEAVYAAEVVKLAPQIDRQKGTREVEVRVLAPDGHLLPDMSVRVVFLDRIGSGAAAATAGAVISRGALRRDDAGRSYVWVVEDGRSRRVDVEAGESVGDRTVVLSGLRGGERVVIGAAPEREGQRVAPGS
jgi:RND family efflux transporter MFP subunit